jgi:hypothetical protein
MESYKQLRMPEDMCIDLSDVSWFGLPRGYILRLRDDHPEDDSDLYDLPEIAVY